MPNYHYTCECGRTFSYFFAVAKRRRHMKCACGRVAKRDIGADHRASFHSPAVRGDRYCSALGCAPEQVPAMREYLMARGLASHECEFDAKGRMRIAGRQHQNRVCKARGLRNLDAGYGDYAGES